MKLSKYTSLVRRESYCALYRTAGTMWLGLRGALYCAAELPMFGGKEQVKAILSLSDKQMDKVYLQEFDCPGKKDVQGFDLSEYTPDECELKPVQSAAIIKGKAYTAMQASNGELVFYDESYLGPISDIVKDSDYVEMALRRAPSGQSYIAIKDGFQILALIMTVKCVDEKYLSDLQEFSALCAEQYRIETRRALRTAEENEIDVEPEGNQTRMEETGNEA